MKKLITVCFAALFTIYPIMAQTKKISLRVIETTDVHGCFFPYDFIEQKPMKGTLARVSTYVNKLREHYGKNLILLDNGDILQGQPTCYYYNYVDTVARNIAADVINYMRYDVQTFGNHDVETGHNVYDKWISEVNCPMVGANIIDTKTGLPYIKPYAMIEREGVRIGVLGMLTPAIPNWLDESLWSGMRFEDIKEAARRWIDYLKANERPDVIIGLFHSGWNGGISTLHYNEDETETVAREVPGFDIIFFGHDHTARLENVMNVNGDSVLCLNPSCNAIMVGDASIEIEIGEDNKVIGKKITGRIQNICGEEPDKKFIERFETDMTHVENYVNRKIGMLEDTIRTRDCFFGSAAFTDLIHNLQLDITGADISFNAPLSFDIEVPKGGIRMSEMFKLYRYENQIYVMKMTGEEIRKHLEMSYDLWVNTMTSPDDHIMLLDEKNKDDMQKYGFKNLTFNFDSAAGIDYEVDVTEPNGSKVKILGMSDGRPFEENQWYKVVMNSYRGNGGGELLTKGAGIPKDSLKTRLVYQSEKDQRFYLTQEIEKMKSIAPKANANWRFVPGEWTRPAIERDKKLIFGEKNDKMADVRCQMLNGTRRYNTDI